MRQMKQDVRVLCLVWLLLLTFSINFRKTCASCAVRLADCRKLCKSVLFKFRTSRSWDVVSFVTSMGDVFVGALVDDDPVVGVDLLDAAVGKGDKAATVEAVAAEVSVMLT